LLEEIWNSGHENVLGGQSCPHQSPRGGDPSPERNSRWSLWTVRQCQIWQDAPSEPDDERTLCHAHRSEGEPRGV